MPDRTREIVTGALRDLRFAWRTLAIADIAYKALAFALLTPALTGLLYWMRSGTSGRVLADAEIALFFVTTRVGLLTLLLGASLIVTITALEVACLAGGGRRLVLLPRAVVTSALLRPRGFVPIAEGCAGSWFVKAFPS